MHPIGFSTGAIAKGNLHRAIEILAPFKLPAIELSALRLSELLPLVEDVECLPLHDYRFVSVHAPSRFDAAEEEFVVGLLRRLNHLAWPIIIHADVLYTPELWQHFGNQLLIENSDKRKPVGRNTGELKMLFAGYPKAMLCFDVGHSRQNDPTMNEARLMLRQNKDRLRQIHLSEVNFSSRHDPLSKAAIEATRRIAHLLPSDVPVILETPIENAQGRVEIQIGRAIEALSPTFQLT